MLIWRRCEIGKMSSSSLYLGSIEYGKFIPVLLLSTSMIYSALEVLSFEKNKKKRTTDLFQDLAYYVDF